MRTKVKPIVIKILIGLGILILGLIATLVALDTAKSRRSAVLLEEKARQIEAQFAQSVAKKNNAGELAKSGLRQLNINLPNFALTSLKRATEIQPNYRDGWLALGWVQFKTNDFPAALASFQTAEKLDPINAKTYELLKISYEKLEDAASAGKAAEKYDFLTKKY